MSGSLALSRQVSDALGIRGAILTPEGFLELPSGISVTDYADAALTLMRLETASQFGLGDLMLAAEREHGEAFAQIEALLEANGITRAKQTLRDYMRVAERIPHALRNASDLEWAHHREVAPAPTVEERKRLLQVAIDENLTVRELRLVRHRPPRPELPPPREGPRWRLIHGNFVHVADEIEPNSLPLVFADPPYGREHLSLCGEVAEFSVPRLVDGGSLLLLCGQAWLPEVLDLVRPHLQYRWTLNYTTPGPTTRIFDRTVFSSWKPLLWFVKGKEPRCGWVHDVLESGERDKRFHPWGQSVSGMAQILHRFSLPGDLVADPMCGGASFGVAALKLDRKFVGIEIEAEQVEIAAARLDAEAKAAA